MIKQEDVTIIIPHLGATPEQRYSLEQCLNSLEETAPQIKKIVVINGLEVGCTYLADLSYLNLSLMTFSEQGQCKAVNAAAATVNTPWILVTNDDMVYAPGWFEKLIDFPQGTRWVGAEDNFKFCVSPILVEPRPGAPTFETHFCGGAGGDFDKEKWLEYEKQRPYNWSNFRTGFNLPFLITKELWDLVGGYDVNYDPWGSNSDSDLEYKIRLAGVQPYQNMSCAVYHFGQTSGTFEPRNQSYWGKNFQYFIDKWGFPRTDQRIWEADFTMPDKERIFRPHWEGFYKR